MSAETHLDQLISPDEQRRMWHQAHARLSIIRAIHATWDDPQHGWLIRLATQCAQHLGIPQDDIDQTISDTWKEILSGTHQNDQA